ncbi:MAG: rhomboid family intramembrane serine protease [Cyclobacteriaceae bacterium]|nr:rhomboid family intramembrane serine protease [Cyclobacteriaceae bacterium]MDH5248744.1 rhomboid family intramembrane serine protease [Cyclobacteriaceae bacterium]
MLEEFKNAFQRPNNGHVQLIIINVVVYLVIAVIFVFSTAFQAPGFFEVIHHQLAIPAPIVEFIQKPWTVITYAFVHDWTGIFHILFNMLVFYWFGKLFVEYLGSDKLIAVYFLGALAGGVAYLLVYNLIPFYEARIPTGGMVGASAAVYAVVVATATLLPDYTFFLLFLGPVRIKYIAGFYIIVSFLGSVGPNEGGNVAHLGGALIGFLYIKQLQAGVNWGSWITAIIEFIKSLFAPKPAVKVTYRKQSTTKKPAKSSVSQAEIDTILDKISDGGYESLTKDEKEKLFNASKK